MIINIDDIKYTLFKNMMVISDAENEDRVRNCKKTEEMYDRDLSWSIYLFIKTVLFSVLSEEELYYSARYDLYLLFSSGIYRKNNWPEAEEVIRKDSLGRRWYKVDTGKSI